MKERKSFKEAMKDTTYSIWMWTYFAGLLISHILEFDSGAHLFGTIMIYFLSVFLFHMFLPSKYAKKWK